MALFLDCSSGGEEREREIMSDQTIQRRRLEEILVDFLPNGQRKYIVECNDKSFIFFL